MPQGIVSSLVVRDVAPPGSRAASPIADCGYQLWHQAVVWGVAQVSISL